MSLSSIKTKTIAGRIEMLVNAVAGGKNTIFAAGVGINEANVRSYIRGTLPRADILEKIVITYDVNARWLLTGKGEMFKQDPAPNSLPANHKAQSTTSQVDSDRFYKTTEKEPGAIPLVSEKAVGGLINEHFAVNKRDILGHYIIPKFRHLGVNFMIEVTGDSMIPRFYPGDIVACSIINNPRFIQWNKCHLIASREQGLLVKRLMPGHTDDCLCAVSDNTSYPPFDIPKDDIEGLARIVGSIHLE